MNLKPLILVDLPTLTPSCSYCHFNCSAALVLSTSLVQACMLIWIDFVYYIRISNHHIWIMVLNHLLQLQHTMIINMLFYIPTLPLLYPSWHRNILVILWMYGANTKEVNNRWHADHHSRSFLTNRAARGTAAFAPSRWCRDLLQRGLAFWKLTAWCSTYSTG